jgi:RNA polymerase sigma-70 factor (ECF subfamily)
MTASPPPAPELAQLEVLYDAHHRQAIGLAYRIVGDLGDAEEVVQEVFLSAWRSGHTYDAARGSTHTWILSMVRNRSIDVLRARQRRPVQQLAEGVDPPDSSDVPTQAVSNVDAETARVAMNSLPPEQKQVIELAYFGGLSHSEIAAQLAAPIGTVKGRIRLGLDHLRVAMGVHQDLLSTS